MFAGPKAVFGFDLETSQRLKRDLKAKKMVCVICYISKSYYDDFTMCHYIASIQEKFKIFKNFHLFFFSLDHISTTFGEQFFKPPILTIRATGAEIYQNCGMFSDLKNVSRRPPNTILGTQQCRSFKPEWDSRLAKNLYEKLALDSSVTPQRLQFQVRC